MDVKSSELSLIVKQTSAQETRYCKKMEPAASVITTTEPMLTTLNASSQHATQEEKS